MTGNDQLHWGNDELSVVVGWSVDAAPQLRALRAGSLELDLPEGRALFELVTAGDGHALANDRLVETAVGQRARYAGHHVATVSGGRELRLDVVDDHSGVTGQVIWSLADHTAVLRCSVVVRNVGTGPVVLRSLASFASYLGRPAGSSAALGVRGWTLHRGLSDWLGEGRWIAEPSDATRFPDLREDLTGHNPRSARTVVSTGTWSSGTHLPTAAAVSVDLGATWACQVEHNGGWRYELGQDTTDGYLALSGPTDLDHQWLKVLAPGEEFASVPVAITVAPDFTSAVAQMTCYRRARRRSHPDNHALPIVFNDYMNTLNGDPTAERLLPLVDAAAAVGAEVFCIDAGWYDDSGSWWDSVGAWQPSTTRFPEGLSEVVDRIRQRGMVPGLWLEPEVVGVRSAVADRLPAEAFLQRAGQRVVEHDRYHLDLRHPAARAHLDAVVDRLVDDFGVGFFKLDYNINPGPGTDVRADSAGDGLLGHNRAHLAWLDGVLDRHPDLILENCGSGAMRADFAMLSRLQLQSTSDQQDPLRYPPIAAAAPATMLPEQAASWAYPQAGMTLEEVAFTLVTGLSGRIYLSGYLNRMTREQVALVTDAVSFAKDLRVELPHSLPFWPLGLPRWDDAWVALGLARADATHLVVWSRDPARPHVELDLADLDILPGLDLSTEPKVEQVFPATLTAWTTRWTPDQRSLRLHNTSGTAAARIFRLSTTTTASDPQPIPPARQ